MSRRLAAGSVPGARVSEFDDEGGLFLLHGFKKHLHLVGGGGVDAGAAVGLAGLVHVGDDAGLEDKPVVSGFGGFRSGQHSGGGAGREGNTHFQHVAAGKVLYHDGSPLQISIKEMTVC